MRLLLVFLLLCVGCAPVSTETAPDATVAASPLPEVTALLKGHTEDAKALASLYDGLADGIETATDSITSTHHIREANVLAGRVMLGSKLKGKYPSLPALSNGVIESAIGKGIKPLDEDTRAKAVKAFRELSTACREAAK